MFTIPDSDDQIIASQPDPPPVFGSTMDRQDFKPEDLTNSLIDNAKYYQYPCRFETAYQLHKRIRPCLTNTLLDRLLGMPGLLEGAIHVFHTNSKYGWHFLYELYMELILRYYNEKVVYIDTNKSFPAYQIVEHTTKLNPYSSDPHQILRQIIVARPFTYHQMNELVERHLPGILESNIGHITKPRLILITKLGDLYLNQQSAQYLAYEKRPAYYSILDLQMMLGKLKALALEHQIPVVITTSTANKSWIKPMGGTFFTHSAAVLIRLYVYENRLLADLIKHPFREQKTEQLRLLPSRNGNTHVPLSDFM